MLLEEVPAADRAAERAEAPTLDYGRLESLQKDVELAQKKCTELEKVKEELTAANQQLTAANQRLQASLEAKAQEARTSKAEAEKAQVEAKARRLELGQTKSELMRLQRAQSAQAPAEVMGKLEEALELNVELMQHKDKLDGFITKLQESISVLKKKAQKGEQYKKGYKKYKEAFDKQRAQHEERAAAGAGAEGSLGVGPTVATTRATTAAGGGVRVGSGTLDLPEDLPVTSTVRLQPSADLDLPCGAPAAARPTAAGRSSPGAKLAARANALSPGWKRKAGANTDFLATAVEEERGKSKRDRLAGGAPGEASAPVAADCPEAQRKEKKKKISLKTLPQLGEGGPRVRQQEPPRPPAAAAKAKKAAEHTTPPEYWKGGGGSGLWTVSPESGGTRSPGSMPRTVA